MTKTHAKQQKLFEDSDYHSGHHYNKNDQNRYRANSNNSRQHGGHTPHARRRRKRNLSTKLPLHLVMHSDFARGTRKLTQHHQLIERVIRKAANRFQISVYEKSINTNHIHLLIRGKTRESIQNFFRVTAGHIAQQILEQYPILPSEKPTPTQRVSSKTRGAFQNGKHGTSQCDKHDAHADVASPKSKTSLDGMPSYKRENKFWETRIYTRIVSWGREFNTVKNYILQNVLEAAGFIPYFRRGKTSKTKKNKNLRFDSS